MLALFEAQRQLGGPAALLDGRIPAAADERNIALALNVDDVYIVGIYLEARVEVGPVVERDMVALTRIYDKVLIAVLGDIEVVIDPRALALLERF